MHLKGKTIAIIGAARSGLALVRLAKALGANVVLSEFKSDKEIPLDIKEILLKENVHAEFGGHTLSFINQSDIVVLSPGVSFHIPIVGELKRSGIEVIGEVEFAYRYCPCPIIAITGSNGKTTTSTLIARMLEAGGYSVCLCGNIGSPLSNHVLNLTKEQVVVLEVSSFQLESVVHFKPKVAVWLNFSENHLDRHRDLDEYFNAKARIAMNQDQGDVLVLNAKDQRLMDFSKNVLSTVMLFNDDVSSIHNPNYLAAVKAVSVFGVNENICRQVFADFKGVEHRLEFVRTLDGVDYINDSKSTTAQAGRWALERMTKPVVMICGGKDKHIDFSVLRDVVKLKVKHMIAIGQARGIMKDAFGDLVNVEEFTDFLLAIQAARRAAVAGDCVILSPMCASFDMFKDFEHRGQVFKELVNQLKAE